MFLKLFLSEFWSIVRLKRTHQNSTVIILLKVYLSLVPGVPGASKGSLALPGDPWRFQGIPGATGGPCHFQGVPASSRGSLASFRGCLLLPEDPCCFSEVHPAQKGSLSLPVGPCSFQGIPADSRGSLQLLGGPCCFQGVPIASEGLCCSQGMPASSSCNFELDSYINKGFTPRGPPWGYPQGRGVPLWTAQR